MKVKDLIEELHKLDPELMVVRGGYEGGVTEINSLEVIKIKLNYHSVWYYGEHEESYREGDEFDCLALKL